MRSWFLIPEYHVGTGPWLAAAVLVAWLLIVGEGLRRKWPVVSWMLVVAFGIVLGGIGSRLLAVPIGVWSSAISHKALPAATDRTLIGFLLFTVIGVWLAARALGFRTAVLDAFAFALPVATIIGRVGCLLSGCCFGTPTSLPWGISYPAGSEAWQVHVGRGLISAGAGASLPVHPVQLYEIAAMLLLVPVLIWARRRLKRPGSLFLFYIAAYCAIRFFEEFVREGAAVLGLREVQWVLLLVAAGAFGWLYSRERKAGPARADASEPRLMTDSVLRNAAVLAVLLGIAFAGRNWFTRLGGLAVTFVTLPPLVGVLVQLAVRGTRNFTRRAAVSAAAATLVFLGAQSDSIVRRDTTPPDFLNFDVSGMAGEYTNCGGTYRYAMGGLGASQTSRLSKDLQLEYGARFYAGPTGTDSKVGINPFARLDSRLIGVGLGGHAVWTLGQVGSRPSFLPSVSLRLGPVSRFFLEADVLDHSPAPLAYAGDFKLGAGYIFADDSRLKVGISDAGIFVNPELKVLPDLRVSPFGAYGGTGYWQVGVTLRYRMPD